MAMKLNEIYLDTVSETSQTLPEHILCHIEDIQYLLKFNIHDSLLVLESLQLNNIISSDSVDLELRFSEFYSSSHGLSGNLLCTLTPGEPPV